PHPHSRAAQTVSEAQTAQLRYQAALGPTYRVCLVGRLVVPFDATMLGYLVQGQQTILAPNPDTDLPLLPVPSKWLAFLFYPGNEPYEALVHRLYPGGTDGEVHTLRGRHLFDTYLLPPAPGSQASRAGD